MFLDTCTYTFTHTHTQTYTHVRARESLVFKTLLACANSTVFKNNWPSVVQNTGFLVYISALSLYSSTRGIVASTREIAMSAFQITMYSTSVQPAVFS